MFVSLRRKNIIVDMCIFSVKMDDQVINRVKPLFDGDEAMNKWMETVLSNALEEYARQFRDRERKALQKERFLERMKSVGDGSGGLLSLAGVLGESRADFSWDELREEAVLEKYGI